MNDQSGQSTSKRLKMSVGKEGQSMHHQQVCRILNLFKKISLLTNGSSLTPLVLHSIELFNSIILNMVKAFFFIQQYFTVNEKQQSISTTRP